MPLVEDGGDVGVDLVQSLGQGCGCVGFADARVADDRVWACDVENGVACDVEAWIDSGDEHGGMMVEVGYGRNWGVVVRLVTRTC